MLWMVFLRPDFLYNLRTRWLMPSKRAQHDICVGINDTVDLVGKYVWDTDVTMSGREVGAVVVRDRFILFEDKRLIESKVVMMPVASNFVKTIVRTTLVIIRTLRSTKIPRYNRRIQAFGNVTPVVYSVCRLELEKLLILVGSLISQ